MNRWKCSLPGILRQCVTFLESVSHLWNSGVRLSGLLDLNGSDQQVGTIHYAHSCGFLFAHSFLFVCLEDIIITICIKGMQWLLVSTARVVFANALNSFDTYAHLFCDVKMWSVPCANLSLMYFWWFLTALSRTQLWLILNAIRAAALLEILGIKLCIWMTLFVGVMYIL